MIQVIILVKEAIYTAVLLFKEAITWWLCRKIFFTYTISYIYCLFALHFLNNFDFLISASYTIYEKAEIF